MIWWKNSNGLFYFTKQLPFPMELHLVIKLPGPCGTLPIRTGSVFSAGSTRRINQTQNYKTKPRRRSRLINSVALLRHARLPRFWAGKRKGPETRHVGLEACVARAASLPRPAIDNVFINYKYNCLADGEGIPELRDAPLAPRHFATPLLRVEISFWLGEDYSCLDELFLLIFPDTTRIRTSELIM